MYIHLIGGARQVKFFKAFLNAMNLKEIFLGWFRRIRASLKCVHEAISYPFILQKGSPFGYAEAQLSTIFDSANPSIRGGYKV